MAVAQFCKMEPPFPMTNPNSGEWMLEWEAWRLLFGDGLKQRTAHHLTGGKVDRGAWREGMYRLYFAERRCHYRDGCQIHYCGVRV